MDPLSCRIGPYFYAGEAWRTTLKFSFDRTFTVLISSAFDAGVIGSEVNGIVVLDDDNLTVVLDRHTQASSGYYGPTREQQAEFERIKKMDWAAFSRFCHDHPRYRRASPDISSLTGPDNGYPLNRAIAAGKPSGAPGRSILSPEMIAMNENPDCAYKFPLATREDIVVFLASRELHGDRHNLYLAWDIRVYGKVDMSGRDNGNNEVSKACDRRWNALIETRGDELFEQACAEELSQYLENLYSTYPGDDDGRYAFSVQGRMGGRLVLTGFDGITLPDSARKGISFESRGHFIEWIKSLADSELLDLYKLLVSVDHDTRDPHLLVSAQIGVIRQNHEQQWADEAARRKARQAAKIAAPAGP